MPTVLTLVAELLVLVPQFVSVGIDVARLLGTARDALDANHAPDDVDWQRLDQEVNELRARLNTDPPAP